MLAAKQARVGLYTALARKSAKSATLQHLARDISILSRCVLSPCQTLSQTEPSVQGPRFTDIRQRTQTNMSGRPMSTATLADSPPKRPKQAKAENKPLFDPATCPPWWLHRARMFDEAVRQQAMLTPSSHVEQPTHSVLIRFPSGLIITTQVDPSRISVHDLLTQVEATLSNQTNTVASARTIEMIMDGTTHHLSSQFTSDFPTTASQLLVEAGDVVIALVNGVASDVRRPLSMSIRNDDPTNATQELDEEEEQSRVPPHLLPYTMAQSTPPASSPTNTASPVSSPPASPHSSSLSSPSTSSTIYIELLSPDHPLSRRTCSHSAAHVLGQAIEHYYYRKSKAFVCLSDGPPLEDGSFFYDAIMIRPMSKKDKETDQKEKKKKNRDEDKPQGKGKDVPKEADSNVLVPPSSSTTSPPSLEGCVGITVAPKDVNDLSDLCKKITKDNQPFEMVDVSVSYARQVFIDNPLKQQLLDKIVTMKRTPSSSSLSSSPTSSSLSEDDIKVTLYKCGLFVDLCRGPHIRSSSQIRALEATRASASVIKDIASWTGSAKSTETLLSTSTSSSPIVTAYAASLPPSSSPSPSSPSTLTESAAPVDLGIYFPSLEEANLARSLTSPTFSSSVMSTSPTSPTSSPITLPQGVTSSSLQRLYGVAFQSPEQLDLWNIRRLNADKIDHRKIGKEQQLFMFHPFSPGSPFFLPHGTRVYNALVNLMRGEYVKRGFFEVRTPQVFSQALWERSGHWQNYSEDMFTVSKGRGEDATGEEDANATNPPHPHNAKKKEKSAIGNDLKEGPSTHTEGMGSSPVSLGNDGTVVLPRLTPEEVQCVAHTAEHDHGCSHNHSASGPNTSGNNLQGLKPMNCPGHCLIFGTHVRSWRELPLRLADFGGLHRNEISGALSGLTRVRSFTQDDAHIFCTENQLEEELSRCLAFVTDIYSTFKLQLTFKLSTRPAKFIGHIDTWNKAECALAAALQQAGVRWTVNAGDGAFYGPKVDIAVYDAFGRAHQCATIQLDFNLPQRFNLRYKDVDGEEKAPVMIHRAVLGSIERFMAILLEHTGGKLPLWLSPRQVMICLVSRQQQEYAEQIHAKLTAAGFYVDIADGTASIAKQVRLAHTQRYNYALVLGPSEEENQRVTLRSCREQREGHSQKSNQTEMDGATTNATATESTASGDISMLTIEELIQLLNTEIINKV